MKAFLCPACEKANVAKQRSKASVRVGRYTVSDQTGWLWQCPSCHQGFDEGTEVERRERAAALVVLHDAEDVGAAELKAVRAILGFRQVDLAALLDVSAETVSRWESGSLPVSKMHRLAMLEIARGVIREKSPEKYLEKSERHPLKLASGT